VSAYRHQKPAPVRQEITPPVDFSSTTGPWDRRASAAKLASFCAIPRGAQPAARNWLCFARTPLLVVPGRHLSIRNPQSPIRDHGPPAQELALFCRGCLVGQFTISSSPPGTYHFLPSAGIGFVLRTCSCSPARELGSFGAITPSFPRANWVRFARFTPQPRHAPYDDGLCPRTPVSPSLASFCTIGPAEARGKIVPGGQIGFVSYGCPDVPAANWVCFPRPPAPA
jgi:hypothetical protein